ncbi:TlyA family RNA methyltransferase [bacterium]|nr:TlyA family RNA methyltransferase [bacterium]
MKKRLDLILFELGYFETRSKASANILAGNVQINDKVVDKAGELFKEEDFENTENPLRIKIKSMPYVSRGGLKLKGAIDSFGISLKDKIGLDVGASTGGFTDCMLKEGAKKVWAIDVGYNQLDWSLKNNEKVVSKEKVNAKNCAFEEVFGVSREEFDEELPNFLSMDLSFISIKKVLENVLNFLADNAELVLLIKPQFEAGRSEIEEGGVVRDEKIRQKIVEDIKEYCVSLNLEVVGVIDSPIIGAKSGNCEYLIYLKKHI